MIKADLHKIPSVLRISKLNAQVFERICERDFGFFSDFVLIPLIEMIPQQPDRKIEKAN